MYIAAYLCVSISRPYVHRYTMHMSCVYTYMKYIYIYPYIGWHIYIDIWADTTECLQVEQKDITVSHKDNYRPRAVDSVPATPPT